MTIQIMKTQQMPAFWNWPKIEVNGSKNNLSKSTKSILTELLTANPKLIKIQKPDPGPI